MATDRRLLAAFLIAACSSPPCKPGTLFVTVGLGGASADRLDVSVSIEGGPAKTSSVPVSSSSGTLEIDFPGGYPAGKNVSISVTGLRSGVVIGSGYADLTAPSGCGTAQIEVGAAGGTGGGSAGGSGGGGGSAGGTAGGGTAGGGAMSCATSANGSSCFMGSPGLCRDGGCDVTHCFEDGGWYDSSAPRPSSVCQFCAAPQWVPYPVNTACPGGLCRSGSCDAVCLLDGGYRDAGALHPANGCEVCTPSLSTSAWQSRDGLACSSNGDAGICRGTTSACCTGCWSGTACLGGTSSSACGKNGAGCAACGGPICNMPDGVNNLPCAQAKFTSYSCVNRACAGSEQCCPANCNAAGCL